MNKAPAKNVCWEDAVELPLSDGTMYSQTNGIRPDQPPFSLSTLDQYLPIVGEEKIDRLIAAVEKLKGVKKVTPDYYSYFDKWYHCVVRELASMTDYSLIVPSNVTARVQESHICMAHVICELVEDQFSK